MTSPRTLLLPAILLTIIVSSSPQKLSDPEATAGYNEDSYKSQDGSGFDGSGFDPTVHLVKPPTAVCGNIAGEWEVLKHHVMSLHGQGAALEALSHHVRALGEYMKHLNERVDHCTCGGGDGSDNGREELIKTIGSILKMSMRFYEAQRSGPLPNTDVPWRGDSGTADVGYYGEPLIGGWYEGGSGVKSILPMAFSTTVLLAGVLMGGDAYEMTGQMEDMLNSVRWSLDYFIKCHVKPLVFYAQVDEPELHEWIRPEDRTQPQPAYMLNETNPGSAVIAETAAALAAGSMVFKERDPGYAELLLVHARQLYEMAHTYRGSFKRATKQPNDYQDELAWGALWLHMATDEQQYVDTAREFMTLEIPKTFSYLDKTVGTQLLFFASTNDTAYRVVVEGFLRQWFRGGSIKYTPRGLATLYPEGGSIEHAVNVAFLAVSAAQFGIVPEEALRFARSQLEYILGEGEQKSRSFMVAYGRDWPQQPRHVGASCDTTGCFEDRTGPNPHPLIGAVVAGPNIDDTFPDDRRDGLMNRVSITINAAFQSAVAAILHSLLEMEEFRGVDNTPEFKPTPDGAAASGVNGPPP